MKTQITSVLGALSYFAFFAGPVRSQAAFEVLLSRNPANRNCRLVHIDKYSYRSTARLGTEITPVHCIAEFGDDSCYSEQILVIGQTSADVWEKTGKECSGLDKSNDSKKPLDGFQLPLNPGWNEDSQQSSGQDLAPEIELRPLPGLVTGSSSNRVDIVFFSDGYTAKEKDKFFDDATRLGIAITVNQTYAPVAPLLNFWGAFTPSVDSGIGVGGKPKNTVYGLYRDGTELRGVYTSKPEIASAACKSLGSGCNYPLLLGNDPLYGGLGGEFTISTASVLNGPLVLRHELGHSIIWIGDEYDGSIYFGPNAAELTHNKSISWAHWLSEPTASDAPPRAERNAVPLLAYPWTMLNTTKAWSTTFTSDGTFSYVLLRFSLSAVPDAKALEIKLDGETISWEAKRRVGLDRWFYDVWVNEKKSGLRNGTHELSFALQEGGKEGLAQLCSVEVIEHGNKNEFNLTEGFVGAFPTYSPEEWEDPGPDPHQSFHLKRDSRSSNVNLHSGKYTSADWRTVSYRPTNEGCLMRQVAQPDFCVVCTEALWLQLLARVNLIDEVIVSPNCSTEELDAHITIEVTLVPLAHLRTPIGAAYISRKGVKEAYHVQWFGNGTEIEAWRNLTRVDVGCARNTIYKVEVMFESSEIRKDEKRRTVDRRQVRVDAY